jgi:hypothetical protein
LIACSRRASFNPVLFGKESADPYCIFIFRPFKWENKENFELLGRGGGVLHYQPLLVRPPLVSKKIGARVRQGFENQPFHIF